MNNEPLYKVSIVIPTLCLKRPLNKKRFFMPRYTIREVLRDIRENVSVSHEVIVICNGNDLELIELVKTDPGINKYCVNKLNPGVARSWNMGAQLAEGDALMFLNDDVSIGKDGVEELYRVLCSRPDAGEVGPKGSNWKGAEHDCYVVSDEIAEADVISGFCFMLKSRVFHALGGFDVNYTPAGFEEIDMSYTIRKHGMKCLVVPNLRIHHYHHHGVSSQLMDIRYFNETIDTETLHLRNKAYFTAKWLVQEGE
jgi:GT2 family glycosyltransferase